MSNKSSALLALVFGLIPAFAIEVCAYPLDTFTPPTFNSGVSGVSIQSDQKLLLAGNFTMVAGVRRTYAARLNPDGTFDPSLGDPGGGTTHTLVQDANGKILMGGAFQFVGGGFHPNIARLNADGSIDPSFTANANGEVFGIYVQPDGKIFIWGTFTMVNGQNRSGVARLNPSDGSLDTTYVNPQLQASCACDTVEVRSLVIAPDGKVVVGGNFVSAAGAGRIGIARFNSDGTLDQAFTSPITIASEVRAILVQSDGKIIAGGTFTIGGANPRRALARLQTDGSLDTSFADAAIPSPNRVLILTWTNVGKILVSGDFSTIGGATRSELAQLNGNGTLDTSFPDEQISGFGGIASVTEQNDGKFIIAGSFSIANRPTRVIMRFASDGTPDEPGPTTFVVTKTADTDDGVCDSDCSLREAVNAANSQDSDDTIAFSSSVFGGTNTVTLTRGQLSVCNAGNLTITGPGANHLTISGNNASRVLRVFYGTTATIDGLTIANGNHGPGDFSGCPAVNGSDFSVGGAGIENRGTLILRNSVVTNNNSSNGGNGGGIVNVYGTVSIDHSVISNNLSESGGGIFNLGINGSFPVEMTINGSTITNNQALNPPAIAGDGGGGIRNAARATLRISNSTISENSSANGGGGIENNLSEIYLIYTTVFGNSAAVDGGGILDEVGVSSGIVYSRNSLIGGNTAGPGGAPDVSGELASQGFNLLSNSTGTYITLDPTGNLVNVSPGVDPVLRNNGGSTPTHALLFGSIAIDHGASTNPGTTVDQRGMPRPYDSPFAANGPGSDGSDIGAFESQAQITTAAYVSVSGRVLNQQGSGIRNARVNLRDSRGNNFTATTNAFGYFSLESILSGETYVAAVQVRGMMFTPRLVTINDSIDALEFRPLQ